jgi:hypothetical protein
LAQEAPLVVHRNDVADAVRYSTHRSYNSIPSLPLGAERVG